MKLITLCSGGLDSTVLVYDLLAQGHTIDLLTFDYGQRHSKEIRFAFRTARRLAIRWDLVDLAHLGQLLGPSALTDRTVPVPKEPYSPEQIGVTIVPNRNAILASIAAGVAVARGYDGIALAVHAGDHAIYPDCRPVFIEALESLLRIATGTQLYVSAPYLHLYKYQIVRVGLVADVPFELTWSCYEGGAVHCGRCSTCLERKEAFALARAEDPTRYEL